METDNRKHPLYLDLERLAYLEEHNPKLLGEIIQKRLDEGITQLYEECKASGIPVYYMDDSYPHCIIREEADGRRFIVDLDQKYQEVLVCEIPRRFLN